jgi:hypothetical protein
MSNLPLSYGSDSRNLGAAVLDWRNIAIAIKMARGVGFCEIA